MDNNEEVIKDMKNATKNLLMKFYQSNEGRKPEKLVMFRDGVSEGQVSDFSEARFLNIDHRSLCSS